MATTYHLAVPAPSQAPRQALANHDRLSSDRLSRWLRRLGRALLWGVL